MGFVIERLQDLEGPAIELTIAGSIDDSNYWSECERKLSNLPRNVQVKLIGPVDYEIGLEFLVNNHFIILPTLGENFGYVLLEALAAGTPLIVSDLTPWTHVAENGTGWSISLDRTDEWIDMLRTCVNMDNDQFIEMSKNARKLAIEWLADPAVQLASERMFDTAMESKAA